MSYTTYSNNSLCVNTVICEKLLNRTTTLVGKHFHTAVNDELNHC